MWTLLEKPTTVKCTAKLAKEFFEMEPVPGDRLLNESRRKWLEGIYKAHELRPCNWVSVYCKETGKTYRANGKHTSNVVHLNGEVKVAVSINLERYECDSLDDVAKLYATFDHTRSKRNANNIYGAFAATNLDLCNLPTRRINLAVAGLAMNHWELSEHQRTSEERAELILVHPDFVVWMDMVLGDGKAIDSKPLTRAAVVAAMARSWFKAKGAATEFWTLVRDASAPKNTTPDRVLNKWLNRITVKNGLGTVASGRVKADNRQIFVKCLHGWNAWRKGETTALQYYANAKIPAAV